MKDLFTSYLSDVLQNQIELSSQVEFLIDQAKANGTHQAEIAMFQDMLVDFNTGVSMLGKNLSSILAKIITDGDTREQALSRMRTALSQFRIEGVPSNLSIHQAVLLDEDFRQEGVDIHHLETWLKCRSLSN